MARSRNIKPGFFANEDLAECSFQARLCFAGLWTLADREGRLEDRPKRIKGELFRFDTTDVDPLLGELVRHGFILRYEIDGLRCIQISKFSTHQTPHYSEKPSVIKPPPLQEKAHDIAANSRSPPRKRAASRGGRNPLIPDSLIPDSRKETLPVKTGEGRFLDFWTCWPNTDRKSDRKKCLAKWRLGNYEEQAEAILAHIEAMKMTRKWSQGFEPAPLRYLNGEQWRDGVVIQAQDVFAGAI